MKTNRPKADAPPLRINSAQFAALFSGEDEMEPSTAPAPAPAPAGLRQATAALLSGSLRALTGPARARPTLAPLRARNMNAS